MWNVTIYTAVAKNNPTSSPVLLLHEQVLYVNVSIDEQNLYY
jgi:hypothetical protein